MAFVIVRTRLSDPTEVFEQQSDGEEERLSLLRSMMAWPWVLVIVRTRLSDRTDPCRWIGHEEGICRVETTVIWGIGYEDGGAGLENGVMLLAEVAVLCTEGRARNPIERVTEKHAGGSLGGKPRARPALVFLNPHHDNSNIYLKLLPPFPQRVQQGHHPIDRLCMFGESDSESPRVPSPWDPLIATPRSSSPANHAPTSSSPLAAELIPKLVPEADDGNVEYKLQLLSPSPARFARLVTQLKWRLLEGGGQAYYELGVADSGALIGLPRAELEQSLETLEMMAGEIGASVIVVKEIEVPAIMAGIAGTQTDQWNGKRKHKQEAADESDAYPTTTTETETENSTTDNDTDCDGEDLSATIVLSPPSPSASSPLVETIFPIDLDSDPADNADVDSDLESDIPLQMQCFSIDLEISSVFKPRPMRTRFPDNQVLVPAKNRRAGKMKKNQYDKSESNSPDNSPTDLRHTLAGRETGKASNRRQTRDRKREGRRKALIDTTPSDVPTANPPIPSPTDRLTSGLEALHVSLDEPLTTTVSNPTIVCIPPSSTADREDGEEDMGDDDVFASPYTPSSLSPYSASSTHIQSTTAIGTQDTGQQARLIVEALVVRKLSLEEAFLDFGGFSLT
ncbi:hypothetical protein BD779DRAFT_1476522 [Infundibulicybe gibba]|nr:hypothetical protein BD779DRAFT_1476522 [Infundibulicybe gibba]